MPFAHKVCKVCNAVSYVILKAHSQNSAHVEHYAEVHAGNIVHVEGRYRSNMFVLLLQLYITCLHFATAAIYYLLCQKLSCGSAMHIDIPAILSRLKAVAGPAPCVP
jgi:hypothetical protein